MKLALSRPAARPARAARAATVTARAEAVLIANTKGGGHAFIGLHAANALLDAGHSVTILNDGDEVCVVCEKGWVLQCGENEGGGVANRRCQIGAQLSNVFFHPRRDQPKIPLPSFHHPSQSKLRAKAPFSQYAALEARGAKVVFGDPAAPAAALPAGASFDVVLDNNGKDMDACQPLIDLFKVRMERKGVFLWVVGAAQLFLARVARVFRLCPRFSLHSPPTNSPPDPPITLLTYPTHPPQNTGQGQAVHVHRVGGRVRGRPH